MCHTTLLSCLCRAAVLCAVLSAGRLDYCTDSWALGMLVLCLRKGKQPFWWLKEDNTLPSGAHTSTSAAPLRLRVF